MFRTAQIKQRISDIVTIPAPLGGWNARDSIAAMEPTDAVTLTNLFPSTTSVDLRKGFSTWADGISGRVESLLVYNGTTASKMFAVCNGEIFDATAQGTVGTPEVIGLTNSRFQYCNFSTVGVSSLYAVNGQDEAQYYDGSTWVSVNGTSTPAITGVLTSSFINLTPFKNRLWFIERNSLSMWYLPAGAIGGAATQFDLTGIFSRGGHLIAACAWTLDAGDGLDDYLVIITSEGEVAVYKGTDPDQAATWGLVGIFRIGAPIGYRCMMKFQSDILIVCQDGVQPISKALLTQRMISRISISDKVQKAFREQITIYGDNFGWELELFSGQDMLVCNVPLAGGSQQYVMNTLTGAWCNFTGWDASCFEILEKDLYFGGTNGVYKAWDTNSDNGMAINWKCLQAFSKHGTSAIKNYKMARPILAASSNSAGLTLGLNVDFDQTEPQGIPAFTNVPQPLWDRARWDIDLWGCGMQIRKDWQTVGNIGYSAAIYLKGVSNNTELSWSATDYIFEKGVGFV